ncbi:carboxymuconolactone decarboxylase family protein [Gordonia jinhuaensis]
MAMPARVEPGTLRSLGPINAAIAAVAARVIGARDMHLFSTLGRSRGLFRAWLYYSSRLMPFGKLSRRDSEMVILRVAHLRRNAYEYGHHSRISKRAGIDDAQRLRIEEGPEAGWGDRERAILRAVDEMVADRDVSDVAWSALARHLDPAELVSFVLLVTQYDGLATTIDTLRIQPDR